MTDKHKENRNQFEPDFLPHPGESLRDYIEEAGMSVAEFTKRSGWTEQHVHKILSGNAGISPEFALLLEKVFNVTARFWNNLNILHDEWVSHQREKFAFASTLAWAKGFPYASMVRKEWIPDVGRSAEARVNEEPL